MNTNGLPAGLNKKSRVLVINGLEDQIISAASNQLLINDLTKYMIYLL